MYIFEIPKQYQYNTSNDEVEWTQAYCYESDGYFVIREWWQDDSWSYYYGTRIIKKKCGDIKDWIKKDYSAKNIVKTKNSVGHSVKGVWRPGMSDSVNEARLSAGETRSSLIDKANGILMLLNSLHEILRYVEPKKNSKLAYGHKIRELLILSCTEVENIWKDYLLSANYNGDRFNTNDYFKIRDPYHLNEFEISLINSDLEKLRPFIDWDECKPTSSLIWYDAYNDVKHNRAEKFDKATLENCIKSVAAALVLFCARYGMGYATGSETVFSSLFNEMFQIDLVAPDISSYYFPDHPFEKRFVEEAYVDSTLHSNVEWVSQPLRL